MLRRPYAEGLFAGPINGRDGVAVQTPLWVPRSVDPAGGIWSTTRDVLRYARFHLAPGTVAGGANVVSPESLQRLRELAKDTTGLALSIGRNWILQEVDGVRAFMHNGDTAGQHTAFLVIPERNFAIVLFTNDVYAGGATEVETIAAALANYPGLAALSGTMGMTQTFLAPPDAPTVAFSPEELAEYTGRYADPGTANTFVAKDGGLELTTESIEQPGAWSGSIAPPPAPPAPVAFLGEDAAVANGIVRLPFVRDAAGRVGWVFSGFRLVPRADSA